MWRQDMKNKGTLLYIVLSALILLAGCVGNKSDLQKQQMERSNSITGTSDEVSDFVSLQKDFVSEYDTDICYNITPQYIVENSDFRIFKYDTSCASFLLYDNEIFPMGVWFGGFGVTNAKLADIDNDGEMELYFTFSWGSGIHRSQAGYFNPKSKEIVIFDYSLMNEDMMIVSNEKDGLSLYKATISQTGNFVDFIIGADDYIADIVFENNSIALSFY